MDTPIVIAVILLAFSAAYILRAIGLMRILWAVGYRNPIHGFVPFASVYALGYAAERYDDGRAPERYAKPLLQTYVIAFMVPGAAFTVLLAAGVVWSTALYALAFFGAYGDMDVSNAVTKITGGAFLPALLIVSLMVAVMVPYIVKRAAAILRVCRIFAPKSAVALTVISTVIPPTAAIVLFAVSFSEAKNLKNVLNDT